MIRKLLVVMVWFIAGSLAWGQNLPPRAQARAALAAERAREKAGQCQTANNTLAEEDCLHSEMDKTQGNYAAFVKAIRQQLSGERAAEFDQLESQSKQYRENASKAAFNEYAGGTLAPVFALEAEQKLLRLHMEEIAFVYGEQLSTH